MHAEHCSGVVIGLSGKERNGFEALRDSLPQVPLDSYYIRAISVASEWRGHGLGRRLMQIAIENGQASGYNSFRLEVRADNIPARCLYEALGFRADCTSVKSNH
jgi:ribosomal protein S18 acetylase RimI-like enzyme